MSSYDITFCATECGRKDCRRNLKYNAPEARFISISNLGEKDTSDNHKDCEYQLDL